MAFLDALLRLLAPPKKMAADSRAAGSKTDVKIERRSAAHPSFVPGASADGAIIVMIADLDGEGGSVVADRLADLLATSQGIATARRHEALRLTGPGGSVDKLIAAAEQGRAWLHDLPADLLVWGELSAETNTVLYRFLPAYAEPDGAVGAFGLGDVLDLPIAPGRVGEQVIVATILAAAVRAKVGPKAPAVGALRGVLADTPDLAENSLATLTPAQGASVLLGQGHAFAADLRCGGADDRLEKATACYRAATGRITALTDPLLWGVAENHRAAALIALAERDENSSPLTEAATAYRAVIEALPRVEFPIDWALAQVRLGGTLFRLGRMAGKPQHYREAAAAYEQALTVFTSAAHPLRWSELMNHYGVLLIALGEHLSGTAALEQAVMVFRKSLDVRRREAMPLLWAQTAVNLGTAAFALAKRNGDGAALRESAACFEGAIEIYAQNGQGKTVGTLQKNLQRVQRLIETRGEKLAASVAPKGAQAVNAPKDAEAPAKVAAGAVKPPANNKK